MGGCDDFSLRVHGRGGHGSAPHTGVDAIMISAAIVQSLQAIVSREQDPLDACVISIGTIHGGYRENIIADQVDMTGTIRTLRASTRRYALERVEAVARQVATLYRATVDIEITPGYPPLVADVPWTRQVKSVLQSNLGKEFVVDIGQPTLGVEDFAYVAEKVPSTVLNLGVRGPDFTTGLHSAGLL
jgi:amidohydrolase